MPQRQTTGRAPTRRIVYTAAGGGGGRNREGSGAGSVLAVGLAAGALGYVIGRGTGSHNGGDMVYNTHTTVTRTIPRPSTGCPPGMKRHGRHQCRSIARTGGEDRSFSRPSTGCPPGAAQTGTYGFRKCVCPGGYRKDVKTVPGRLWGTNQVTEYTCLLRSGGCGCMRAKPVVVEETEEGQLLRTGGVTPRNRNCARCMSGL